MSSIKIIAEIGINHDGLYERAAELIEAAAEAGVQAVKFQYRNLDNAYSSTSSREIGDEILLNEIHRNYLPPEDLLRLGSMARDLGLEAGISFFDVKDIDDFGEQIDAFNFFKLPSAELTNTALIDAQMALGKHLYISTGCHSEAEIEQAFSRLAESGWTPLHCISNYPVSLQNARLGYINYLRERWNRPVGYSSHDEYWETCLLALQYGVRVIERHITLDKSSEGLDHSSSSTPGEFAKIATFAREMDLLLAGDGPRVANQGELLNRQNLGRSYFAAKDLPVGHVLSEDDLSYRTPNVGLNRLDIDRFLGHPLKQPVAKNESIVRSMFYARENLPDHVIDFAKRSGLALPVRLHDLEGMQRQFPIGAYEFHLSFNEVLSDIDTQKIEKSNRYSIHLPDYINSTQLMDPFSRNATQREGSLDILERTVTLAERLQQRTGTEVPIVGSFSVVHHSREDFFEQHAELLNQYRTRAVRVMPQWLPPIAWYFGGSVRLHAMNDLDDAELLLRHGLPFCLDICHMIMGRNCYGFDAEELIDRLAPLVGHVHIADAAGIDGEGMPIGEGEPENLALFNRALGFAGLKVIEVWQGHLDQGAGFRKALMKLEELYGR
ncbi:MAG: N-acetylneuraminate synthase family protein [Gammaproteobacteria bacterium]